MPPFFCLRISDAFCPENLCEIFCSPSKLLRFCIRAASPNDLSSAAARSAVGWSVQLGPTWLQGIHRFRTAALP